MTEVLDASDKKLLKEKDNKIYKNKWLKDDYEKRWIFRTYLSIDLQDNKLANKFLLDEYLDMDTLGNISINIVEIILTNISKIAFIKTTENIETIYTQYIRAQCFWNVIKTAR